MPGILCIETSSECCSVSVCDDDGIKAFKFSEEKYSHASELTILIENALKDCQYKMKDLAAVGLSKGPGSFTSLRVGASVAKGLCFALGIPLISIDTLELIAVPFLKDMHPYSLIIPMIDARRDEVYLAAYDKREKEVISPRAHIIEKDSFVQLSGEYHSLIICGNAVPKAQNILSLPNITFYNSQPSARHMIKQVFAKWKRNEIVDVAYFEPFYLKPPNITVARKKLL